MEALIASLKPVLSVAETDSGALRLITAIQALSMARSLDNVIDIVRTAAREIANADGATFILREDGKCYYVNEDAIAPLWKGNRYPEETCVSGWAMINRRPAVIKDIFADERVPIDAYRPTFVKSLVMVPIRTDAPIGAIGIYWGRQHHASDFEVELLQALANSTSVAIENVNLYAELEKRVALRTKQLEDSNRELETFSYSVSHDLQAPLRHIMAYAKLMEESHGESGTPDGKAYLHRIQKSATRMEELIADLLRLARLGRSEIHPREINLSALAHEVAAVLRQGEPLRKAEIIIDEGLTVKADHAMLRIVLENLLGNAWKFTSKQEKTRIELHAQPDDDGTTAFSVRDNGAGFDMTYAKKLFAPFQRMHSESEFPGTGIGLATVQRIIHRHGGSIWVESKPNEGTTFYFRL